MTPKKIMTILLILALICLLCLSMANCGGNEAEDNQEQQEQQLWGDKELGIDEDVDKALQGYRNILLCDIGNQEIDDYGDNTPDSIVVMSINRKSDEVRFISVYRNALVQQDNGVLSMKSGYTNGGMSGQIKAVNQNLDLNIRECMTVNWELIANLIDDMGGIELEVNKGEMEQANEIISEGRRGIPHVDLIEGTGIIEVSGWQAVAYDNVDFDMVSNGEAERNERHREVVEAALYKAGMLTEKERLKLVEEFIDEIDTNVSKNTMVKRVEVMCKSELDDVEIWPETYVGKGDKPDTLETNVISLHQKLFNQKNYKVSEFVKSASKTIAEE